jgi:hypothetical protein
MVRPRPHSGAAAGSTRSFARALRAARDEPHPCGCHPYITRPGKGLGDMQRPTENTCFGISEAPKGHALHRGGIEPPEIHDAPQGTAFGAGDGVNQLADLVRTQRIDNSGLRRAPVRSSARERERAAFTFPLEESRELRSGAAFIGKDEPVPGGRLPEWFAGGRWALNPFDTIEPIVGRPGRASQGLPRQGA